MDNIIAIRKWSTAVTTACTLMPGSWFTGTDLSDWPERRTKRDQEDECDGSPLACRRPPSSTLLVWCAVRGTWKAGEWVGRPRHLTGFRELTCGSRVVEANLRKFE